MAICCEHSVFFYLTESDFPQALNRFFGDAIKHGSPMVLIMTPEHRAAFDAYLRKNFLDPKAMKSAKLMIELDANDTLSQFWDGRKLNAQRYKEVVGGVLRDVQAHHGDKLTWAYGEMVDLLVKRGFRHEAVELEHMWNDLAKEMSFSLLCGYGLDPLARDVDGDFVISACQAHSRVLDMPHDHEQSARVQNALKVKIGVSQATHFWNTARYYRKGVPEAYNVLLWLRRYHPGVAQSVYEYIRDKQPA